MRARSSPHTHHRFGEYSYWIVESYLTNFSVDAYISRHSSLEFIRLSRAQMLPGSSIILLYIILEQLIWNTCLSSYFQKRNFHQMCWPLNLGLVSVFCKLLNRIMNLQQTCFFGSDLNPARILFSFICLLEIPLPIWLAQIDRFACFYHLCVLCKFSILIWCWVFYLLIEFVLLGHYTIVSKYVVVSNVL